MALIGKTITLLLLVIAFMACGENPKVITPNKCQPVELFVETPEGGEVVSGVTIIRDGSGNITTKWKTTLPSGTQSMMNVGLYKPNPKKDIPYGPIMDSAGLEKTSCNGNFFTHNAAFTNEGAAYNEGLYYAELAVIDNVIWKQPQKTRELLAAARGKVKGVTKSETITGNELNLTARFELPLCSALQATTTHPDPTPMSKQAVEGVARKLLTEVMEKKMSASGRPASLTVSGPDNTIITVESSDFTRETVTSQVDNKFLASFRKMHFKQVIFTNGNESWSFDIK